MVSFFLVEEIPVKIIARVVIVRVVILISPTSIIATSWVGSVRTVITTVDERTREIAIEIIVKSEEIVNAVIS